MNLQLKNLHEQTIVITGATSGIGLATARMAARRGARLVLSARGEEELRRLANEIEQLGGEAIYVVADVADEAALRSVATAAVERFGERLAGTRRLPRARGRKQSLHEGLTAPVAIRAARHLLR